MTTNRTKMLDNADMNIGNGKVLSPQQPYNYPTIIAQTTDLFQAIKLCGSSSEGMVRSVVLTACRQPGHGGAGPVTAILEFGSGSQMTRCEVDVPTGPFTGKTYIDVADSSSPQDGGVVVTVPAAALNVYFRYDNNLLAAAIDSLGGPSAAAVLMGGVDVVPHNNAPAPVLVKAMAADYSRHFARAYKTQYCYCGPQTATMGVDQKSIDQILYAIPAFARSVQVLRRPLSAAMRINLYDGRQGMQTVEIPANQSPTVPIVGQECVIGVGSGSDADADKVSFAALCYEIGI